MVQIKVPILSVILCLNPLYMYFYAVNKKLKPNKGMSPHPQPVSTFEYIFFLHILLLSRIILLLYPPILSNFLHKLPKITQQNYKENNTKRALAVRIGILSYAFL